MFKKKSEEKNRSENNNLNVTLVVLIRIAGIFIFCIFGIYFLNFGSLGISNNSEVWAQFGDFIGGILNPLLAFLAFIALLFTIKLQSDALNISKEELEATRKELEKSRIAQEKQSISLELQNKATNLQIFENTFFQLISLFNNTLENLNLEVELLMNSLTINNVKYLETTVDLNKCNFLVEGNNTGKEVILKLLKFYKNRITKDTYDIFNEKFENITGVYFGQIYQILKLIHESNIEKKERYINIIRVQFTKEELEFLFYHCLGIIGKRKFKKLIEDYSFFEHIISNKDIEKQLTKYNIKAFGNNKKLLIKYNNLKQNS